MCSSDLGRRRSPVAAAAAVAPPSAAGRGPALASRARAAAELLTGMPARIAGGRLEIPFADETQLAELVEALEGAAP